MSAQALREMVAELVKLSGLDSIGPRLSETMGTQLINEGMPPAAVERICKRCGERLSSKRFQDALVSLMIELGVDEASAKAAVEFYKGPGSKFVEINQSPMFLGRLMSMARQEAEAAMKIASEEMERS
jgi:hypothetical protein